MKGPSADVSRNTLDEPTLSPSIRVYHLVLCEMSTGVMGSRNELCSRLLWAVNACEYAISLLNLGVSLSEADVQKLVVFGAVVTQTDSEGALLLHRSIVPACSESLASRTPGKGARRASLARAASCQCRRTTSISVDQWTIAAGNGMWSAQVPVEALAEKIRLWSRSGCRGQQVSTSASSLTQTLSKLSINMMSAPYARHYPQCPLLARIIIHVQFTSVVRRFVIWTASMPN
jgi:hypothetical protein